MWKTESLGSTSVFDDVEQGSADKLAVIVQQISAIKDELQTLQCALGEERCTEGDVLIESCKAQDYKPKAMKSMDLKRCRCCVSSGKESSSKVYSQVEAPENSEATAPRFKRSLLISQK